jgi:predicted DNA-binding transcriptional regulator AlpA
MWKHVANEQVPIHVQNERIIELLEAILAEVKSSKMTKRLWSIGDIAAYLSRSKNTIQQRVVCKIDFPNAVRIPTNTGRVGPLWYQDEVKAYVKKHQKK